MTEELKCSFCGHTQKEVAILIAAKNAYICERCVLECHEALMEKIKGNIIELKAITLFLKSKP